MHYSSRCGIGIPGRPSGRHLALRWGLGALLVNAAMGLTFHRPVMAADPTTRPATQPAFDWPRPAPPDAATIAEAEKLVRGVFKEAYDPAAALPAGEADRKANFGRRFLMQGTLAEDDPGERFVLLSAARDFAAAGGDSDTAMRAVSKLDRLFNPRPIDTRESALAALAKAGKKVMSPDASDSNLQALLQLIEGALSVGDFDLASRAIESAGPLKEPALEALVKAAAPLTAGVEEESAAGKAALQKLSAVPDDAAANLVAGTYLCFDRADWEAGISLLAKGSDAQLKALAAREAAATDAPAALATADAWWDAAGAKTGRPREGMRRRAAHWYLRAAPELPAAQREPAEKRLAELRLSLLRPGLITDLYDGQDFVRYRSTRLEANIDIDWHKGSPGAGLGPDHFSVCWQGHLQAPKAGKYEFEIAADDGFYVRLDDKEVMNEWHSAGPPTYKTLELTGQPQAFEMQYVQITGEAYCHLRWKPPGEAQFTPVPATVFTHDPVWPWGRAAATFGCRPADAAACPAAGAATVWFKQFPDALPWHAAGRRCEQMGGHLAWSLRPEHHDAIGKVSAGEVRWLGASDDEIEGRWEWTNGRRIDPEQYNWAEGEPNGGREENYLVIKYGRGWNDSRERQGFICQWDR